MKTSGAAVDVLLSVVQNRLSPGDAEFFVEQASRINAPEGLGQVGSLVETWNPVTESLTIDRARVLRGGEIIDLLAGGRRFTVLRREANLEAAVIDGKLTATLQPEGLQVGDVLDFAFTLSRRDPALAGHAEGGARVGHAGAVGRLSVHASWPTGLPVHTWKTDDLPTLTSATQSGWTDQGFDQTDAISPEPPKGAASFLSMVGVLSVGDFKDWADVSRTAYPLFAKAATLAPDSPLKMEIARIRNAHQDAKGRALAALELVENQTRYLLVSLDAGGYTPAAADLTWTRRFGDCKGKTVLLLALLQGLGIQAEPALVNTTMGEAVDRALPQMGAFDHVLVRAEINGDTYWLDGTRVGDENLDILPIPNFHWALPLRPDGAALTPLNPKDPVVPFVDLALRVDARQGIDKPARAHEDLTMRGDLAWAFSRIMKQASRTDADRALRAMLTYRRSWLRPDKVGFTYDPQRMEGHAVLEGSGTLPFTTPDDLESSDRNWFIEGAEIGEDVDLTRTSDYHRDAPFLVAFPAYTRVLVEVDLPDHGKGFEAYNADTTNRTVAGVVYSRTAAITGDRFSMIASQRAVAPSFPASDSVSAQTALRNLAAYNVMIHYSPSAAGAAASTPTVASAAPPESSPVETATSKFLAKDYAGAETAFTVALNLHPSAKLYYDRAAARAAMGKDALATADLKAALQMDPKHAYALFALGRLDLARGDHARAASHFAAAQASSSEPGPMASMIAKAYEAADRQAEAFSYWDQAAADTTSSDGKANALNAACWARAQAGVETQGALRDCDESLRLRPNAADTLDSRGLVDLRLRNFGRASTDYSAALARRPDSPTSLFGRAIAERQLGQTAKAEADVAAAVLINPKIEATFARWGFSR